MFGFIVHRTRYLLSEAFGEHIDTYKNYTVRANRVRIHTKIEDSVAGSHV